MSKSIPLALYIHIPWCLRKCPYCDFNSHKLRHHLDEDRYIDHLLADFATDYDGRPISSIFIGGGTPSLFSGTGIARLLNNIRQCATLTPDCEITLEANPSTFEQEKFHAFYQAGVNRLSIGVQSFQPAQLSALHRIHSADEAKNAITQAQEVGFSNLNVDLMFALPAQTPVLALDDLKTAIDLGATHLSWYQLTIEPNTVFARTPPTLPDEPTQNAILEQGSAFLKANGFQQYEVSAWTRACPAYHNLNYWQFGDYIGIGAGAHGKQTQEDGTIYRREKRKNPKDYQSGDYLNQQSIIAKNEQAFEFMMNGLRLKAGVARALLNERTQIKEQDIQAIVDRLIAQGLMEDDPTYYRTTKTGFSYLNEVLLAFLN